MAQLSPTRSDLSPITARHERALLSLANPYIAYSMRNSGLWGVL
jgi:hypothetical protein